MSMVIDNSVTTSAPVRFYRSLLGSNTVHMLALLLLFSTAAVYEALRVTALSDSDIWWRLQVGSWILQNQTIPHTGLFSQHAELPWIDFTWGFDVLSAAAYQVLGLRAIPALLMVFKCALALVTFLLARVWGHGRFWLAVSLSAIAQYVLTDLRPSPSVLSILFFGIQLLLLLQSRRSGDIRPLYWLPLLFWLWANVHIQFLNGLLLLALFLITAAGERALRIPGTPGCSATTLPLGKVAAVAGGTLAATLLTPYTFQGFADAVKNVYSDVLFTYFAEMGPLGFRQPRDFVLALLVMAAFVLLGRQRSWDLFKLVLMSTTTLVAFRIQRDSWLVVLSAIAVLGDAVREGEDERTWRKSFRKGRQRQILAFLVVLVLVVAVACLPSNATLMNRITELYPRNACDFIKASGVPGPLLNAYAWGGFLIWYLPEYPVTIDSRVNLYSTEMTDRYFKTATGNARLEEDPDFNQAGTILLERGAPMAKALTTLPVLTAQYRLAYADEIAVVLVRR